MGPTGAPTEIEPGETVVLAGGGLGNAVLFSIGQAFREAGSRVLYFAGYKKMIDRYKVRRDRGGCGRGGVVQRRGARLRGGPAAGPRVRRQHRAGDARLRGGRAGRAADPLRRLRPHHRHRLGQDDGGGGPRAPRRAGAVPQARASGDRLHQLADAVHDEGDLRAVPAAAHRPGHGQGDATSSRASTRTSRSTTSISRRSTCA